MLILCYLIWNYIQDIYNLALTNYKLDLALQIPIKKDYTDKDFEDIYKLALKTNEEIY